MKAPFRKLAIIGLGLIGSSIAKAARQNNLAASIVGIDNNEVALSYARKNGFIDKANVDPAQGVRDCDAVVIAAPTESLPEICRLIAPHLADHALVMDTGSVKKFPLLVMSENLPGNVLVVPAHPIAGSEQSGVAAGNAELFIKKRVIITPQAPLDHEELQKVDFFWRILGARVEAMPAELHDDIYGYVSHLPQAIAFAVGEIISPDDIILANYPQLKKFLRLSSSRIELWSGIFRLNQEVISAAIERYIDAIAHIEKELSSAPQQEENSANSANSANSVDESSAESSSANYPKELLFARIAASCLITTVMEAEKKYGLNFARFAGSGFADMTAPAADSPDNDIERISKKYKEIIPLLAQLKSELKNFLKA